VSEETAEVIVRQTSPNHVEWRFSPSNAPHFRGLWESEVCSESEGVGSEGFIPADKTMVAQI